MAGGEPLPNQGHPGRAPGGKLALEHGPPGKDELGRGAVLVPRQAHDRGRIGNIRVPGLFRRVVEVGGEAVEVALGEGVELVVVAGGAAGRQAEERDAEGLHAVPRLVHVGLLGDVAALVRREVAPHETRGRELVPGLRREKVPASCSRMNRSKGLLALKALIT
jgi:hypothetical protein